MLWLTIICFAILIYMVMAIIVNHDKLDDKFIKARALDYLMTIIMILILMLILT